MTKTLSSSDATTIRRQELGEELQTLRKAARLTLDQAARRIAVSASKLCRIEGGQRTATIDEIGGLLALYAAEGAKRKELLALAHNCGERGWWQRNRPDRVRTLRTLESRAESIVNFAAILVPSLLQTGEYARAIMEGSRMMSEDEIENGMVQRIDRHSLLMRREPPNLLAILDELVLHRVVGGPDVLRRQLEHLVKLSQQRHIRVRVVPNHGVHSGMTGDFELIRQLDRPTVVFVEQPTSSLFVEEPDDVDVYRRIVQNLLDVTLDETQSVQRIAELANARMRERAPDAARRPQHFDVAQKQL